MIYREKRGKICIIRGKRIDFIFPVFVSFVKLIIIVT